MGNHRFLGVATSWDQIHTSVEYIQPFVRRASLEPSKPAKREPLSPEAFRALLERCGFRQIDAAWLCDVHVRQVRAWCLGEYPVPQYAALLLRAYADKLLPSAWLDEHIAPPKPRNLNENKS